MWLLDVEDTLQSRLGEHLRFAGLDRLVGRFGALGQAGLYTVSRSHEPDDGVRIEPHGSRLGAAQDVARPLRHLDHAHQRSGIVAVPVADFDPIERSRRYVLGETNTFYGVWDTQAGPELVEQFPLTDEGFEQAVDRYHEMKRRDRTERGAWSSALWLLILVGVLIMVVGGVMEILAFGSELESLAATNLAFIISTMGFNVMLGGLALLVGLVLIRREALRDRGVSGAQPIDAHLATGTSWPFLAWVLVIAAAVWVLSAVATQFLFPPELGFGDGPGTASRMASTVESLAFRVWVAALAVIWARQLLSSRMGGGKAEAAE